MAQPADIAPTTWALGFDHAGFPLATHLRELLVGRGDTVITFGPHSPTPPVDYPEFCIAAAGCVAEGAADWGIVVGGSGQGEQIAANKVRGVRAALCTAPEYAELARRHNDANVLALPGRFVAPEYAEMILDRWIATDFEAGRHVARLALIDRYERGDLVVQLDAWPERRR